MKGLPGDEPRVARAERSQRELIPASCDELLAEDHVVRGIWEFIGKLDLSGFYERIQARGESPGRPATDPRILLTLWVFALSEGIGSARALADLCTRDLPYRWICGGVSTNHHTLSDFRTQSAELVDDTLTQVIAVLMKHKIITLRQVAQDGTRVRASAGASSFRRKATLEECLGAARKQLRALDHELQADAGATARRIAAARERAARERVERIQAAIQELPALQKARESHAKSDKQAKKRGEVRASATDKDARVMKMPDGGFRPAYNVQLATDVDGQAIVGVDVSRSGSDAREVEPMLAELLNRTGTLPPEYLIDGGYVGLGNIRGLASTGITPYAPMRVPKKPGVRPEDRRRDDGPAVAEWRERMTTEEAKAIYRKRAQTAERTNADLKQHRGLGAFTVRGLAKVKSVVLLTALTFNILRAISVNVV